MAVRHRLHRRKWLPASGNSFVVGGVGAGVITILDDVDFEKVKENMEVVMLKMAETEVVGPESGGREGAIVQSIGVRVQGFCYGVKKFQSVCLAAEEEAERRSLKEELMSGATNLEEVGLVMVI
ncbi:hypothetical protein L2E82_39596 [Cichorium intybus]|uniref:Uncharacterized protein n=1 Tax=Cichorium intybus TaxID=13427 RepID=A0ACB9AHY6_CICIN|nr:hypothetical protein L2E82_39596 [Cichorium intybus]